jgi:hypothetical protein
VLKKISSLAIVGAVATALLVAVAAPSQAAVAPKANGACATLGAKATIKKVAFTCAQNPLTTTKQSVWVSGACTTANKSFTAALKQRDSLTASFNNAISKINAAITVNSTDAVTWQGKVDKYNATLNAYLAAHPNVATTGAASDQKAVTTLKSAIASLVAEVARLNSRVTSLKAQLSSTQDSQGALIQSAADNVASLKTQLSAICKSGL